MDTSKLPRTYSIFCVQARTLPVQDIVAFDALTLGINVLDWKWPK
jgi:hypothetical protein